MVTWLATLTDNYAKILFMPFRLVFMGSPEFALPSLRELTKKYTLGGVVTQPDRPAGRGRTLTPPPIKTLALELGLPFIQPQKLRQPEAMEQLRLWKPDLIVVAAFGQILRPDVLDLPSFGCINVHASLLPRWRGAAPVQAAILNGDDQTGITIIRMDPGVDTGPIINQQAISILPHDTAGTLAERLAELGASLLVESLPAYLNGEIIPQPQDDSQATYASMLKKEDGILDFTQTADQLARRVRAFNPWPGAYTLWQSQILKIHRARAITPEDQVTPVTPGQLMIYQGMPAIGTAQGLLSLDELQPAGKKPMPGKVFLQGVRNWNG